MTPRWKRWALAAFLALSGAFVANVFVLQPVTPSRIRTHADGPAAAWSAQWATNAVPAALQKDDPGDRAELTRAIQRELQARGYETGAVDGVPGFVTRAAIMAFEADRGMALTGEPREALLQAIVLGAAGDVPRTAGSAAEPGPEAAFVISTVQHALSSLGYAPGSADGRMSADTVRAIRNFEAAQGLRDSGRVSGELAARLARVSAPGNSSLAP
jgi:peptidoglycan hydrolase-like protein with peptidoglycan-binding domain